MAKVTDERSPTKQNEDAALIGHVWETYVGPWLRARRPWVLQYILNHAYYSGHQFVEVHGGTLRRRRRRPREVQIAHNQFKPACRVVLGQVTKNRPVADVRALNSGFTAEAEVQVARKTLKSLQYGTQKASVDEALWLHLFKGGNAAKQVGWDTDRGGFGERHARDDENELLYTDLKDNKERTQSEVEDILVKMIQVARDEGSSIAEQRLFDERFTPVMETGYLGDVGVDVWSLLEYATAPNYIDLNEARVMYKQRWRSIDYIRAVWPELGKAVAPENDVAMLFDTAGYSSLLPGAGIPRTTGEADYMHERGRMDGAVVREFWVKPTERNPLSAKVVGKEVDPDSELEPAELGMRMVWANNVILEMEDLPYANTPQTTEHDVEFDLSDYRWMTEPGFYGSPMLTDAVPMQNAINRHRGMIIEAINSWTHAKLLMPSTAMTRPGAFSNEAMEVVDYTGVPPSYLEPPTIPPHMFKVMEHDTKMLNDTLMLHEVSREGRVPPQVRTASALLRLQETDNLALAPVMYRYEESERQTAQMLLDRAKQFYDDGRMLQLTGERNKLEVAEFKRQPFTRNRYTVYIHEGSSLPDSTGAQLQTVFELAQYMPWFFVNPKTGQPNREAIAQLLNFANVEDFVQDIDESRQAAERENMQLEKGVQMQPLPTDEDAIHLNHHYPIMHSPDFREKPEPIKKAFYMHAALHEQALLQKQQNAGATIQMMSDAARQGAQGAADPELAAQDAVAAAVGGENGGAAPAGPESVDLESMISALQTQLGG